MHYKFLNSCHPNIIAEKPILNTERITKAVHQNESHELEIRRYDQLNLICPFENYNIILWHKVRATRCLLITTLIISIIWLLQNGDLIKKIETTDCNNYENGALNLNHSLYGDRGEYVCTAENIFGQNNYTYHINIVWPPKIISPSYNNIRDGKLVGVIKVQLNQELILNCVVDSNPKSEVCQVLNYFVN